MRHDVLGQRSRLRLRGRVGRAVRRGTRSRRAWISLGLLAFGLGGGLGVGLGVCAGDAQASLAALEWRRVSGLGPVEAIHDLALDADGRVALADPLGVIVGRTSSDGSGLAETRRIASAGVAARVRFDGAGGLFVAGEHGLVHVDARGVARDRTPPGGQGDRALLALDVRDGWLAVGGSGGLHVARLSGAVRREWLRVNRGLAAGGVSDVAIGAASSGGSVPLFAVSAGELHLIWLQPGEAGPTASFARRQRPPGRPIGEPVRRVRFGPRGRDFVALYARATARLVGPPLAAAPAPGEEGGARWEVGFPLLPPGAEITDAAPEAPRLWLATSAGLLVGPGDTSAGRHVFARAAAPAGTRPVGTVVATAGRVFAASGASLLRGDPPRTALARGVELDRMPRDPALSRVQARALEYLGLEPERMQGLWRGAARRGWWPSVEVRGGADYRSGRTRDYDESFSYGQLSRLNDRNSARTTDYDAGVALSWDLADIAFSSDSVDVSREARQVIGLRDNVLDEINQLYFDRRRVLRALSAFADWSDPEAAALRLRALELAAGLDGWTGGWFSQRIELPDAARSAWSIDRVVPALGPRVPVAPFPHPEHPVPTHAGRNTP